MEATLVADGIPLAYLEAYPFSAFVVEIPDRSLGLQNEHTTIHSSTGTSAPIKSADDSTPFTPPPSQAPILGDIEDFGEVETVEVNEEEAEGRGGLSTSKPKFDSLLSRWSGGSFLSSVCPIDLAVPRLPDGLPGPSKSRRRSSRSSLFQYVDGKGSPTPPSPQRRTVTQRRASETTRERRQYQEYFDHDAVSPLSKPAVLRNPESPSPLRLVWSNDAFESITHQRPLNELVDPASLSAFRNWLLESDSAHSSFALGIIQCGVTLDLIRTIQPGVQTSYAVVTAARETDSPSVDSDIIPGSFSSPPPSPRIQQVLLTPDPVEERRPLITRSGRRRAGLRPRSPLPREPNGQPMFSPGSGDREREEQLSCARLLQETDWASTPAGPMKDWPPEVHSMIRLIFTSSDQDSIWVGSDMRLVYNEASTHIVDHPRAFGARMEDVWKLFWPELKPLVDRAWKGEAVIHENDRILFELRDELGGPSRYLEKYHSFSFLPIMDSNEKVIAIYNPTADNTARILAERRLDTTRELVEHISLAKTTKEFFESVADVLEHNPADAPFVICYSVKEKEAVESGEKATHDLLGRKRPSSHSHSNPSSNDSPASIMSGAAALPTVESKQVTLQLESSVGIPEGHKCAPTHRTLNISKGAMGRASMEHFHPGTQRRDSPVPLRTSLHWSNLGTRRNEQIICDGLEWPMARALATRQCVVVHNIGGLIEGIPIRQWNDLPNTAIIIPISSESSDQTPPGVLILGLNLYRPLDGEYEDWVQQIRGHLSAALNSAIANEKELKRRIDQEKLDRAKTAWFRGVAQEFRSPLTLISGPLDELSTDGKEMDMKQMKKLNMAKKNVFKLEQLVTSLLDFSKIELGKFKIHYFLTNLKFWLNELFDLFKPTIGKIGKLRFELEIDHIDRKDKELIYFDPILLEMVVSNLLSHSIKNSRQKESPTTVTLKLEFDDMFANISVVDTGNGDTNIDDLESANDWFKQTTEDDEEEKTPGTSSGISLALVKEIVRLHHGQFKIESRTDSDHGNTITARIPLKYHLAEDEIGSPVESPRILEGVENDGPDHNVSQAPSFGVYGKQVAKELSDWNEDLGASVTDSEGGSVPEGLMFEKSDVVLVVDENRDTRDYIRDIFDPYCTVLQASNGYQALDMIQTGRKPNVVICDLLMSKMTGLELLSELRATHATQFIPLVFLSPVNDDDLRVSTFVAGAEDFILKPFKPKELLLRVHLHAQIGKKRENLESLFSQRTQEMAVLSDYCPSGILRSDCGGNIIYANEAFREPAGMDLDSSPNDWISYVSAEQARSFEKSWQALLNDDSTEMTTKLEWKWKTGKTMSGTFINLKKLNQNLHGILACVTDISYKEELLIEAENRRIQAEESKRHQELLVDLTSHEIRTPVSAILQCSSLVKENLCSLMDQMKWSMENDVGFVPTPQVLAELDADVDALESIFTCGTVQERIANDILSLARIQLDMLSLHDIEMDLQHEAQKKLSVFASEARMKNIDIDLEFDQSLEKLGVYGIKTDPVRLGQVVTNLISNAIRFTSNSQMRKISVLQQVAYEPPLEGSTKLPPSLGLEKQYSVPPPEDTPIYLYVTVSDTGPGMSASEQELLFQRFQQGNKMIHTQYGGSGLGLFICKKITEMLGGGISVESKLGEGTKFSFFIKTRTVSPSFTLASKESRSPPTPALMGSPVTPATELLAPNGVVKRKAGKLGAATAPTTLDGMADLRVLIVEDNLINQTVLKRQLTKAGMQCDTAGNGEEALRLLNEAYPDGRGEGYDVVLMDLEMPIMDGGTAIRIMRASANSALQRQLVIALTGNAREGQIVEALKAGMDHVIIKPYKLDQLIAKMRDSVAERKESKVEKAA